jgi:hypothetical protein
MTSLENQKLTNKMINSSVTLEDYIELRNERDAKLKAPRYIHPSIQVILKYVCIYSHTYLFTF